MLDKAVHDVRVKSAVGFDPNTALPTQNIVVTYSVGEHGPFTLITPRANFSEQYLEAETGKMVAILRAAGTLPDDPQGITYAQR